jgi:hypothetical protein
VCVLADDQPSKHAAGKFHDNFLLFAHGIRVLNGRLKIIEKNRKINEHIAKNYCSIALRETAVLCVFAKANKLRKRLAQ